MRRQATLRACYEAFHLRIARHRHAGDFLASRTPPRRECPKRAADGECDLLRPGTRIPRRLRRLAPRRRRTQRTRSNRARPCTQSSKRAASLKKTGGCHCWPEGVSCVRFSQSRSRRRRNTRWLVRSIRQEGTVSELARPADVSSSRQRCFSARHANNRIHASRVPVDCVDGDQQVSG